MNSTTVFDVMLQFVLSRGRESYSEDEDEEPLDFRRISV